MTDPEIAPAAQAQVDHAAAGPATEFLERLAEKLGGKASVSAVFGEPVERDGVTIIPVAKVSFGFGGGVGKSQRASGPGEGGGGGGGIEAAPLGYIEIKDGNAVFKSIRDPMMDVALPLAILVLGSTAPRILRRLFRSRRK